MSWIPPLALIAAAGLAACGPVRAAPGCEPDATSWTVWVTNQAKGVDTVTVLDDRQAAEKGGAPIVATIPVGRGPHNLVFSPDRRFAYVVNLGTPPAPGTVSVIDTATYQVVATVQVGVKSHGLAVTPDGKEVWVANELGNDVSIIDTATNQAAAQNIPVGDGPLLLIFTPDGKKAYVSNGAEGTTSVVDVATRKVTRTLTTGRGAMGLVVTADGSRIFEAEGVANKVSVIDTGTDSVTRELTYEGTLVEPHSVAMAGHEVLITNRSGQSVAFVDSTSLLRTAQLAVSGRPDIIAVSPDCTRAYFSLRDRPGVAAIDVRRRVILDSYDLGVGDTHGIAVLRTQTAEAR